MQRQYKGRFDYMNKIITILSLILLISCSQEPEVFTGPFVIRDGIKFDQKTNEPVNGIVEEFHVYGQLSERSNYIDGKRNGLYERFHENGQLSERSNYIDGKLNGPVEKFDSDGNRL